MPFWQSSAPSNSEGSPNGSARKPQDPAERLNTAQVSLTKARRNLLGAGVLLLVAFLLIPLVLDKAPRAWGEDVILNMPKSAAPYVKPQGAAAPTAQPVPLDNSATLKPSQPVPIEAAAEAAPAVKVAP